jgi:hypothetical protein
VTKTGLIGECRSCREKYEGAGSVGTTCEANLCGQVCDTHDIVEDGSIVLEEHWKWKCMGPMIVKGK